MDKKEIAAETLQRLISNPPPDVDLTLVGGGALILWIEHYREHYPGNFDSERIAGTEEPLAKRTKLANFLADRGQK